MDDAKNLAAVMGLLDNLWPKLTTDLNDEQLDYLKTELAGLETRIKSAADTDEVNELSRDFFDVFTKIKSLEELANINNLQTRSASLPDKKDEIKIKLINYCVLLQDRIHLKREEGQEQKE